MTPITRRTALVLGGAGTAAVVVGVTGLLLTDTEAELGAGDELVQPEYLRSSDGVLAIELVAGSGARSIGGRSVTTLEYNGSLPGPTIVVRAGDRLRINLRNDLTEPTNLHVHGLHVSPEGRGDNVLRSVAPGESFDYAYEIPADHSPGVYWYHPHVHGSVATQLWGGLYGAIIVEDAAADAPVIDRERVLVISDLTLRGDRVRSGTTSDVMLGREGELVLVNGMLTPVLSARPGERERWRVVNACSSRYLRLTLDGQRVEVLGIDSGRAEIPSVETEIVLMPGNRADLLVTAQKGTASLMALPVDRGSGMGMMGGSPPSTSDATEVATFRVDGTAVSTVDAVPGGRQARDLRNETVTGRRQLVFAMGMGMGTSMTFTIDGKAFDASRVDTAVAFGAIEEWELVNTSPMDHPVHLHVWPMQVVEHSDVPVEPPAWRDVVNVPANGTVRVLIAFEDFAGTTVYHCHILDHEDQGMMGIITVS